MAIKAVAFLLLAFTASLAAAQSAPAPSATGSLPPGYGEIQAQLRAEIDPQSFVTSFTSPGQQITSVNNQYGSVSFLLGQNSPALATLPNGGLAQGIITLQPCGVWSPHTHARANEILYVAQGNLSISFHEENAANTSTGVVGGRVLNYTVPTGNSIVIPQGLMHFAANPTCSAATIVTSFDNRDPGTVSIATQFFELPTSVIAAATGLDSAAISIVRSQVSKTAVISVDNTCLQSCPSAPASASAAPSTGR